MIRSKYYLILFSDIYERFYLKAPSRSEEMVAQTQRDLYDCFIAMQLKSF